MPIPFFVSKKDTYYVDIDLPYRAEFGWYGHMAQKIQMKMTSTNSLLLHERAPRVFAFYKT